MEDYYKRVVLISLLADFVGAMMLIGGLSSQNNLITILTNSLALLLYVTAFISCFKNYQKSKLKLLLFLALFSLVLIALSIGIFVG